MKVAVICLARAGDICNTLAMVKHIASEGHSVDWVVDVRYKSVLLGASYVTPVPTMFGNDAVLQAIEFARGQHYGKVLMAHTYGKHWAGSREHSYNLESWLNCGYTIDQFHDLENFPLVFDERDADRETFLCRRHIRDSRPVMLMAIGCGNSSPFPSHHVFTEAIKKQWGRDFCIVNLCHVKAGRIYDLLGLMDAASLLITGDTAALHLASAVPSLPVIALVNNAPFLGTTPRGSPLLLMRYANALARVSEVHGACARVLALSKEKSVSTAGTSLGPSLAATVEPAPVESNGDYNSRAST